MNTFRSGISITLMVLFLLGLSNCNKTDKIAEPPEAGFSVKPENGNTTTIFTFNTDHTINPGVVDTMLFFRWDWNNDGTWDTNFSRSRAYDHRFRLAGTYEVVLEVSNKAGLRDTVNTTINIIQGYSPPQPVLLVTPGEGHIRTEFLFDGSQTTDDEDSLNQLEFRWDWEGDGFWDTQYGDHIVVSHRYTGSGFYRAVMQVRDPAGLTAKTNIQVPVSLDNLNLVVDFTWTPDDGSSADVFTFDASSCFDPEDPDNTFLYRWDFNFDGVFDTEFLIEPTVQHQYSVEGETKVKLEIADKWGLTNRLVKELIVLHANQPPKASFYAGTHYGNLTTNFYFDAMGIQDDEDWENEITVRWDFDSDGNWDTDFAREKTAYHQFSGAGDYTVTLEAKDSGGLTDQASLEVHVSEGTNPTGLILDSDSGDSYGTVKIGDQWWTAENLKNTTNRSCYRNQSENCEIYGGLYRWNTAMNNSTSPGARGLCPSGWHIPTLEEWETLFAYLGGPTEARAKLEPGGETDFRMLYGGQIAGNGVSEYGGSVTNFWTSTSITGDNSWAYGFQAGKDNYWKLALGRNSRNSVRCIKN